MAYQGLYFNWIEQWSQFIDRCNWYTFNPILLEIEDDRIMGGLEMTVVLLGLGLRVRWNYTETEQVREIQRRVEEIKSEHDL